MRLRNLAVLAAALALPAFMPHESTAPTRWALVIGISDYTNFGSEIGGDLPGAAWDARRMRDVLTARWGFEEGRVKLLLDGEATRARIQRELTEWLPSVVQDNDEVLVFFAGHGSQSWDTNGDEADGLDETICPADVMKGSSAADINDDEIEQWLRGITRGELVVVLDNCHSGTGTRAVTPFARPRSLARSAASDLAKPANASVATGADRGAAVGAATWIEIAAAQADEVAVDAEWPGEDGAPSTYGGAFTTNLVRNLWRVSPRTTYEELFRLTVEDMKRERFAQQPLFTGNGREAVPFARLDENSAARAGAVPVIAAGATIELAGGAGAGMSVGSIYRAGDALLRVTEVRADRAVAVAASGQPKAGAAAELIAYNYPTAELRVSIADVNAATQQAIRAATNGIQGLVLTTDPRQFAHLLVRPAERGYVLIGMDGAQRHAVAETGAAAAAALAERIRNEASAQQLSVLDNPAQATPLEFGFVGGRTTFKVDDEIAFEVRVPRAGYLAIVDLGTDGQVNVIYPMAQGDDGRVAAGTRVRLPAGEAEMFEAQAPPGRGIVRAFLTEQPLGLAWKEGGGSQAAQVAAALRRAAGRSPVAGSQAVPLGSWLTASIVYTIENK